MVVAIYAVAHLRNNINVGIRVPQTVSELIAHYAAVELKRKAFATRENHKILIRLYIEPRWESTP